MTSETLVDFRATGELWRTSERLLLYLKCSVGKRQRTVWQCDFQCWKKIQNVLVNLPRLHSSSYPYICMWDVLTCGIFYQRHASRDLTSPSRFCWTRRSSLGSGLQSVKQMETALAEFLYYTSLWHRQRNGWEVTSASTLDSVIRIDYCKAGWNMLKLKVQAVSICKERRWLEAQSAPLLLAQGPEIRTGFFKDVSSFGWTMIGYLILLLILSLMSYIDLYCKILLWLIMTYNDL